MYPRVQVQNSTSMQQVAPSPATQALSTAKRPTKTCKKAAGWLSTSHCTILAKTQMKTTMLNRSLATPWRARSGLIPRASCSDTVRSKRPTLCSSRTALSISDSRPRIASLMRSASRSQVHTASATVVNVSWFASIFSTSATSTSLARDALRRPKRASTDRDIHAVRMYVQGVPPSTAIFVIQDQAPTWRPTASSSAHAEALGHHPATGTRKRYAVWTQGYGSNMAMLLPVRSDTGIPTYKAMAPAQRSAPGSEAFTSSLPFGHQGSTIRMPRCRAKSASKAHQSRV
mmetsp:Transcript_103664/g.288579  ORF Transcript_103664/g.288579 Transcript_103664/m.288579 type:complete len:287 (-) Transcript_103664:577-1437(-)